MAFKVSDFKKTTRKTGNERLLYPYQIRDDRYTAAIAYATAYYERMVGRRRAEFETETLLEFFGDTRLARGLVACLGQTYIWRAQTFTEAFGDVTAQALWRVGLATPAALRARLHGLANGRYGGVILPHERAAALDFLCADLPLTPAQFEQALSLDADDQRILVKQGPTPDPAAIIARYNYHSLETALCHAGWLRLELRGSVWNIVRSAHNLARRYRLRYEIGGLPRSLFDERLELTIHGGRDAMGSWSRAGRRLVRILLRLLAAHPSSLASGEAQLHLQGRVVTLRLDERLLGSSGLAAYTDLLDSDAWEEDSVADFQKQWSRAFVKGRTAGWRLRRDPEPLISADAVVVPDFSLQRGNERLALCLVSSRSAAEALVRDLARSGKRSPVLVALPGYIAETLRSCPAPLASYAEQPSEAIPALVALLERTYPRATGAPQLTPWQRLEQLVVAECFVSEETVAALLGCPLEEAARTVQRWGGPTLHVLPGLGVCAPDVLDDIRQLIDQGEITQRAA
jgi:hypothetical protein